MITDISKINFITSDRAPLDTIDNSSKICVLATISWSSENVDHIDEILLDNLNAWRDFFPPEVDMQLNGKRVGDTLSCNINDDEFIPPWNSALLYSVKPEQFNRHFRKHMTVEPAVGRFYPRGIFTDIPDNYISSLLPCRLVELDADKLVTDFNHPLSKHRCTLEIEICQIWTGAQERGGRCNDIVEMCTADGPGMQARWQDQATDFWTDDAFTRLDDSTDTEFYSKTRLVHHLDAACRNQITSLYDRLLPDDGDVLDLMTSWVSHLPDTKRDLRVTGLGLNQEELDSNPVLSERIVQDLNSDTLLPFDDACFDAAVCTASIEYLTSPADIFEQLARVLKPGAPLIITFSDRWFPPKAIKAWTDVHDFERMGIVAEHFIENGCFDSLHTWSLRDLPRPEDDKYADQLLHSDPVFAVWAVRK